MKVWKPGFVIKWDPVYHPSTSGASFYFVNPGLFLVLSIQKSGERYVVALLSEDGKRFTTFFNIPEMNAKAYSVVYEPEEEWRIFDGLT